MMEGVVGSHISRRSILIGCGGAISALYAGELRADPIRKDVDLRTTNTGDPSWVLFFGRNRDVSNSSFAGHAFVGVGKEDPRLQMSWLKAFGLYPKNQISGAASVLIGAIPGELKADAWSKSDIFLSCRVSSKEFKAARAVIDSWTARTQAGGVEYQLMHQDCVSFTLEAAKSLKLKLPPRESLPDTISLPVTHIGKLLALNNTTTFANGLWTSDDPAGRWKLEISYDQATWTEKNSSGQLLTKSMPLIDESNQAYTIKRDNTNDVLQYLGARDSVRQAILARNPSPSYMKLQRKNETLFDAKWYGLKWTLDSAGNLNQINQPGTQPPTTYSFKRAT